MEWTEFSIFRVQSLWTDLFIRVVPLLYVYRAFHLLVLLAMGVLLQALLIASPLSRLPPYAARITSPLHRIFLIIIILLFAQSVQISIICVQLVIIIIIIIRQDISL